MYGADECQITAANAKEIQEEINKVNVFAGVRKLSFEEALDSRLVTYIDDSILDSFTEAVPSQRLCGGGMCLDKNVSIAEKE